MKQLNSMNSGKHWIWADLGSLLMFLALSAISGKVSYDSFTANFTIACYLTICALGQMIVMTTGRGAFDLSIPLSLIHI